MSRDYFSSRDTTGAGYSRNRQHILRGLFPQPVQIDFATKSACKVTFFSRYGKKIGEVSTEVESAQILKLSCTLTESGCGAASFILSSMPPFTIDLGFTIDIHFFQSPAPWYSGILMQVPQGFPGGREADFEFRAFGFVQLLEKCLLRADAISPTSYAFTDVTSIAFRLANDFLAPRLGINVNPSKIEAAYYNAYGLNFELATAKKAYQDLADIAQDYVFGVDAFRDLFFRRREGEYRSTQSARQTHNASDIVVSRDMEKVVNRVHVKGAKIPGDAGWLYFADNPDSQLMYGLREEMQTAPTLTTKADVMRWADYQLLQYADPDEAVSLSLTEVSTIPIRPGQNFLATLPVSSISLSDAFDDLDIDPSWICMTNGALYTETATLGALRVTPGRGVLSVGTPTIPMLFKRVRGDFEVTTELSGFAGVAPYVVGGFAGIHVRRSPSAFLELGRARISASPPAWRIFRREVVRGELITTTIASVAYDPVVFRVRRVAGRFDCQYGPSVGALVTIPAPREVFSTGFSMYAALTAYTNNTSYGTDLASHYHYFQYFQHSQLADYYDLPVRDVTYTLDKGMIRASLQLGSAETPLQGVMLKMYRDLKNDSLRIDRQDFTVG